MREMNSPTRMAYKTRQSKDVLPVTTCANLFLWPSTVYYMGLVFLVFLRYGGLTHDSYYSLCALAAYLLLGLRVGCLIL